MNSTRLRNMGEGVMLILDREVKGYLEGNFSEPIRPDAIGSEVCEANESVVTNTQSTVPREW